MTSGTISTHDNAVLNRIFNPNLPYGDVVEETADEVAPCSEEVETDEVKEAKQYEADGVTAAEAGDLELALSKFGLAIQVCPTRGSGYNNRAQALRLKGDVQGALQDLHTAIELSEGQGSAACQAFTQRGLIFKLEGEEEKALEDFKRAGALGGQFAKQQVVAMNPYAALCNQMLSEVMRKVKTGET
ncbi:tetratricopeptide repeat protein 36 homolog [Mizuhopecten yessoensis]|uniref:tetratricopeptide repeat protein 36 homolog n=1 Tax=Mizuhopecten yessoensis TaxID=6573 RepID=UPI000B45E102|nr:tetratricopeptide repeat protein 36 homolog [Mizuhopecten yessoensis]